MTLPFAGFPGETFDELANCKMKAIGILRRSSDRQGVCRKKGQRRLACEAKMPLASFNWAANELEKDGVITITRQGGRRPFTYEIKPEHLWVTPPKINDLRAVESPMGWTMAKQVEHPLSISLSPATTRPRKKSEIRILSAPADAGLAGSETEPQSAPPLPPAQPGRGPAPEERSGGVAAIGAVVSR